MESLRTLFYVTSLAVLTFVEVAVGHGGMTEPPMRSIAWKYGFDTPVNYDWMSLYCGGLNVFTRNNGKCGLCGDPYTGPYENDKGGIYDTGVIVRHYPAGLREIEVKVEITAHHKGYFQFKLCPNNAAELTQGCLDRYPLLIREGEAQGDPTRYYPPTEPNLNELHVRLPAGVICDRCVLQWTYTAGNNIGRDIQETFVNCADISIGGTVDTIPVLNKQPVDGDIVVIDQRPNITAIIEKAPSGSVNEVISALSGQPNRISGSTNPLPVSPENQEIVPGSHAESMHRFHDNRDPRMFIPSFNDFNSNHPQRLPSNLDTPGFTSENGHETPPVRFPNTNNMDDRVEDDWFNRDVQFNLGSAHGPQQQLSNSFFEQQLPGPSMMQSVPRPSEVWNEGHSSTGRNNAVINERGSHNSLLGSVNSVVGQISNEKTQSSGNHVTRHQSDSVPSTGFVHQMTELPRTFTNNHEWRRGDGRWLPTHAVRQSPMLDTHEFTTGEIGQIIPSLPADIGQRQDIPTHDDPRFNTDIINHRNNWFPGSQQRLRQQRMRNMNHVTRSPRRLPRRIEVHSMAVAQHLLRKYPQLRGRVFLSRQGHIRNTFSHMMNKYARRRNWNL